MRFPFVPTDPPRSLAPRGRRRRPAALGALVLASIAGLAARPASAANPVHLVGKRVIVDTSVTVQEAGTRALAILEQAVGIYEENLPYKLPEGEKLVFHLYEDVQEYGSTLEKENQAALAQSKAATVPQTKETHLVVVPRTEVSYLRLVGNLPEATRFFLCHEGARQFLLRTARDLLDTWPDWYGQGVCSWLAQRCLEAQAGKDAPPSVFLEDRTSLLKEDLADGHLLRLDRLLHANQTQSSSVRTLYAAWHDFVGQLAADPARFATLHKKVRDLGIPVAISPTEKPERRLVRQEQALVDVVTAVYGPLDALDAARRARIAASNPAWMEIRRFTERTADGFVVACYPQSNAFAMRSEPAPKQRFVLTTEVQVVGLASETGHGGEVHLYLAHEGVRDTASERFLDVVLRNDGRVLLEAFADGRWQTRYAVEAAVASGILPPGERVPVRVTVDAKTLLLEVGAGPQPKRLLDVAIPSGFDPLGTLVGLGTFDEVAVFHGFSTAPAPK